MCFIEYNWTASVYSFRIGDRFTDWRGVRSLPSLAEWRDLLAQSDCTLRKTDSRTWQIECTTAPSA